MAGMKGITFPAKLSDMCQGVFMEGKSLEVATFEAGSQLECIGSDAFVRMGLSAIVLPAELRESGASVFARCGICDLPVDEDNPVFIVRGSLLLNKDAKRIVCCCGSNVSVPVCVEEIGAHALRMAYMGRLRFLQTYSRYVPGSVHGVEEP